MPLQIHKYAKRYVEEMECRVVNTVPSQAWLGPFIIRRDSVRPCRVGTNYCSLLCFDKAARIMLKSASIWLSRQAWVQVWLGKALLSRHHAVICSPFFSSCRVVYILWSWYEQSQVRLGKALPSHATSFLNSSLFWQHYILPCMHYPKNTYTTQNKYKINKLTK